MRANEYRRGYHDAMRAAVTWLFDRADEMNDRHAQRVLTSAADSLGHEAAALRIREPIAETPEEEAARRAAREGH